MNKIRQIQELNKKELEHGISPNASWHTDYRDTAFIFFGGLPYELSEGDVITIFSQYGEPVFLKLARDPETGKSKGFGWLKYEDQRSTDLAVDNLGGASINGRMIHVDHTRYKIRDDENEDDFKVGWSDIQRRQGTGETEEEDGGGGSDTDEYGQEKKHLERSKHQDKEKHTLLPEERELERLIAEHDDEDPMKEYLIEEKKRDVEEALRRLERSQGKHKHRHRSRHSHRHDRDAGGRSRSHRKRTPGDSDDDARRRRHHRHGDNEDTVGRQETTKRSEGTSRNDLQDGSGQEHRRRHSGEGESHRRRHGL